MSKKILLVEDSPTQAKRTQLILANEGYDVEIAENGREGLDQIKDNHPDMVITDIAMPVMNGYRLCQLLKTHPETSEIPVVMLTSKGNSLDIIKGLEVGADNFIKKPFEDYYLISRVRKIFSNLTKRKEGSLPEDTLMLGYQGQIEVTTDRQQILELLFSTINGSVPCDVLGLLLISNSDSHLFFQISKKKINDDVSYEFKKKILNAAILFCRREPTIKLRTQSIVKDKIAPEIEGMPESFASVPLINNSQTIGMLAIANIHPDMFDTDDVKFLFQLGTKAAQAFDRIMR